MKRYLNLFLAVLLVIPQLGLIGQTISYPDSSVLAHGNWYKITVPNTGLYKLTYSDFVALGVPEDEIKSANLSVYGNGGKQISLVTAEYKNSDLLENSIYISDASGSFKNGGFAVFYAQGNNEFFYNPIDNKYSFRIHPYSYTTTYFITFDENIGLKKRVNSVTMPTSYDTVTPYFRDYFLSKQEVNSPNASGRNWLGKQFTNNSKIEDYPLDMSNSYTDENNQYINPAIFEMNVVAQSEKESYFISNFNNQFLDSTKLTPVFEMSYTDIANSKYIRRNILSVNPVSNKISIKYSGNSIAKGWIDYMLVSFDRSLKYNYPAILSFKNTESLIQNKVVSHLISNVKNSDIIVWDVTNHIEPKQIIGEYNSVDFTYRINLGSDSLLNLVAFNNNSSFNTVNHVGKIENQNLHATPAIDYVIITHPLFKEEAERLADIHRNYNNTSTVVVDINDIYNEFSSGTPDVLAYREYLRMLYNKYKPQGLEPKNVLLFGDGTFDNKNILKYNNNFILTWQSENSLDDVVSYPCEDYIAYLSPYAKGYKEMSVRDTMLIGIGRFPVNNLQQAKLLVDKSERYLRKMDIREDNSIGDWRNTILLTSDDADNRESLFVEHAESIYYQVKATQPELNAVKVYADAYKQYASSAGTTYPDASKAINQQMKKGALILNYVGHGSPTHLSAERLITITDMMGWTNYNSMPVFITSTCEFARFDMVDKPSAGEYSILNENGGAIALISASRKINSEENINNAFHKEILEKINGRPKTIGEAFVATKNARFDMSENKRSVLLLGDPALRLSLPMYNVKTDSILSTQTNLIIDTIKALQQIKLIGSIVDDNDSLLDGFNGILQISLFDKASNYHTLDNDGANAAIEFEQQKNLLYKGKVDVINGKFNATFTIPKDLAYNYGAGKFSYYAQSDSIDAAGYYNNFIIGGIDNSVVIEETRPVVRLYIADSNFVSGGITNENPELFAIIYDKIPINTVGSGLGHDIMATLDNAANTFILNDFYEQDYNDPNRGYIKFPFNSLSDGEHTLTLKAWNIFNYSNSATITFNVNGVEELVYNKLRNYPNPFSTSTSFYLEHNQKDKIKSSKILIFNSSGSIVKTIEVNPNLYGYTIGPIEWDGTMDGGRKLQSGIYFYRMQLDMENRIEYTKAEKLVIL